MSDIVKLTFKDLKNERFTIEAGTADTISTVKAKIQTEKGWEPSTVKLIYSGKILQDAQTVGSYSIDEKGFIVCMVSKAKTAPKASSSSSAAAPTTPVKSSTPVQTPSAPIANAASSSTVPAAVPETPTPAPQVAATSQPTTAAFNDPSSLAMGSARESAILQMTEMGFPRPDVEAAMRAAFNNPDRAVEYLMTGIPEHLQREAPPAQSSRAPPTQPTTGATAAPAATTESQPAAAAADADEPVNLFEAAAAQRSGSRGTPAGGRGGAAVNPLAALAGGGGANLDFLRNNPQFQQLRQVIQEHPQMLEPILQQVGQANPQLAQLISTNPEGFLRLLGEGIDEEELAGAAPGGGLAIHVTEEERDAIERLCQLGFERDVVIQAYFACDKNEEMAANFLFENPQDPEP
ncbi:hypothetical protein TWF106_002328 [Orbilia oligospora]|uniref:UV excision repair protein RAD23 n=2 Tax=Orbilia oligospora TaxID=2813651 RepID=A0A6G1MKJ0_ORBOL|nr:hypothetical protein TWF788_003540 [Orbilia oligospora]KAF3202677.1 hypothetical protein TWF106_002328 [Orbilia oligospora]KAF3212331.1 hypothetical protein TWF679_006102 [Orbilia oligospora]KAF3212497.1 hypothetical protein TWF191_010496 [Orbilia oligospora]KAF3261091.1 hypothetical protein TWF192_009023 [Orbilia oligospora]